MLLFISNIIYGLYLHSYISNAKTSYQCSSCCYHQNNKKVNSIFMKTFIFFWKCIKKLNEKKILVSGGGIKKNECFYPQRISEDNVLFTVNRTTHFKCLYRCLYLNWGTDTYNIFHFNAFGMTNLHLWNMSLPKNL